MNIRLLKSELNKIFRTSKNKHAAHKNSCYLLEDCADDLDFLKDCVNHMVFSSRDGIQSGFYPQPGAMLARTANFEVVLNVWFPHRKNILDQSTKAIHHHGNLLLSTVTIFGSGYTHWIFSKPKKYKQNQYNMEVIESEIHPAGHVGFVGNQIPHCPFYPKDLSITLCVWSTADKTSWVDHMKANSVVQYLKHYFFPFEPDRVKSFLNKLGLLKKLNINEIELFDFYPDNDSFRGMIEREEFLRGPNYFQVQGLLYLLQKTQINIFDEKLSRIMDDSFNSDSKQLFKKYLKGDEMSVPFFKGHELNHTIFNRSDIIKASN